MPVSSAQVVEDSRFCACIAALRPVVGLLPGIALAELPGVIYANNCA